MTDTDRKLREQLRKESDDLLFAGMELNDRIKQQIRQQAAVDKKGRRFVMNKTWMISAAGLTAAVLLFASFPLLEKPSVPVPTESPVVSAPSVPPANEGGAAGSELSPLITTKAESIEAAKTAFGEGLLVPGDLPEGFALKEIVTVGMQGEPVRDAVFTYASGEKTLTFAASRMPAAFPVEMFTKTQVGDAEAFVFEQPELTELFWFADGIQYSITGPLSADQAIQAAESAA